MHASDHRLDARLPRSSATHPVRPAAPATDPQRWASSELFGNRHEIAIAHGESVYRLRITSLGKLILTK